MINKRYWPQGKVAIGQRERVAVGAKGPRAAKSALRPKALVSSHGQKCRHNLAHNPAHDPAHDLAHDSARDPARDPAKSGWAVWRWPCGGDRVAVAVWRWPCGGGRVAVAVWRWPCSGGRVAVTVWRWPCGGHMTCHVTWQDNPLRVTLGLPCQRLALSRN